MYNIFFIFLTLYVRSVLRSRVQMFKQQLVFKIMSLEEMYLVTTDKNWFEV